jgi:hypothetical protein
MSKSPKITEPASSVPDRRETLLEGQEVAEPVEPSSPPEPTEVTPSASESTPESAGKTAEAQSTTPEPPTQPSLLDRVRELGYTGEDETEAVDKLLASYRNLSTERDQWERRIQETEELARYGTEYLQKQREQTAQQAAPVGEATGKEPWWNPPKFESKWIDQYRDVSLGEDGQPVIGWKKNTPRDVQEAAEKHQQYLEQWATDLVQRPHEVLPKIIEQEFDTLFERRIQERDAAAEMATFATRVRETNEDWMYTKDSQGREVLTAEGQRMTNILGQVAQSGVTNPQMQWQYAVAMYDYQNRAKEATVASTSQQAQQTAEQKRRQQAALGAGQANRTGTVPRPEEEPVRAQNKHLSAGEQLLQQLRSDGAEYV